MAFEAYRLALEDAAIEPDAIDASVVAAVPEYHKQRSVAGVVQEYLNLNPRPTWLTEVACVSDSEASPLCVYDFCAKGEGGRLLGWLGDSIAEPDIQIGMPVQVVPHIFEEIEPIKLSYTVESPTAV